MAYLGDKLTDEEMAKIEKRLESIYKQVSDELDQKAKEYFLTFAERYKKEYAAYKEGKYTDLEFKSWYLAQVGRGKRWFKLKADAAQKMTETNKIAAAYVNGKTPGIYALNANFTAFEIESESGVAFNLVNEDTVRELALNNNHSEFKTLSVNPKRDYAWNFDKIQNNLLAGILQGKSIDKIADTFYQVMQNNKSAAVRNARTAVTSAQNAGRQNTFNRAEEMGITIQKEWISTHDGRVRDSHAALDGVRVNNDRPFPNGLRYPGDPSGAPAEVYNCRCTMRSIIPKYNDAKRTEKTSASYAAWVLQKTASSGKIKLPDIYIPKSVGAKYRNYDVMDESNGEIYHFVEGTKLQNVEVFAGYGTSFPLRDEVVEGLTTYYKSKSNNWQHVKGFGLLDMNGEEIKAEVHWFQEASIGKIGFKVKRKIYT